MRPETDRFWQWIKSQGKKHQMLIQSHVEGRATTVEEDALLQKLWSQYLLREDPFE